MTDEAKGNGTAGIREVYDLVAGVQRTVSDVDDKLDAALLRMADQDKRLTIIELVCTERPARCTLEHAQQRHEDGQRATDRGWTVTQRITALLLAGMAVAGFVLGLAGVSGS